MPAAAAADRFLVMGDQYSLIMIMIVQAVTETCVSGDTAGLREPTVTEDWPREEASNCTEEFIVMKLEEFIEMKLQPDEDRQPPRRNEDFTAKKLPPECLVKARAPPRLFEHPPPLLENWQPEDHEPAMAPPQDTSFAAEDPSQIELYQSFAKDLSPQQLENANDQPPSLLQPGEGGGPQSLAPRPPPREIANASLQPPQSGKEQGGGAPSSAPAARCTRSLSDENWPCVATAIENVEPQLESYAEDAVENVEPQLESYAEDAVENVEQPQLENVEPQLESYAEDYAARPDLEESAAEYGVKEAPACASDEPSGALEMQARELQSENRQLEHLPPQLENVNAPLQPQQSGEGEGRRSAVLSCTAAARDRRRPTAAAAVGGRRRTAVLGSCAARQSVAEDYAARPDLENIDVARLVPEEHAAPQRQLPEETPSSRSLSSSRTTAEKDADAPVAHRTRSHAAESSSFVTSCDIRTAFLNNPDTSGRRYELNLPPELRWPATGKYEVRLMRDIGGQDSIGWGVTYENDCRFGRRCLRDDCDYSHFSGKRSDPCWGCGAPAQGDEFGCYNCGADRHCVECSLPRRDDRKTCPRCTIPYCEAA